MANGHGGHRPGAGRPKRPDPWALTEGERVNLLEYCKSIGYDPVVAMAEMAVDEQTTPAMRFACNREVAKYIHPTLGRVNIEHSGKIEGDLSGKDLDELRRMVDAYRKEPPGAE